VQLLQSEADGLVYRARGNLNGALRGLFPIVPTE